MAATPTSADEQSMSALSSGDTFTVSATDASSLPDDRGIKRARGDDESDADGDNGDNDGGARQSRPRPPPAGMSDRGAGGLDEVRYSVGPRAPHAPNYRGA
jgi:hypothetical protein